MVFSEFWREAPVFFFFSQIILHRKIIWKGRKQGKREHTPFTSQRTNKQRLTFCRHVTITHDAVPSPRGHAGGGSIFLLHRAGCSPRRRGGGGRCFSLTSHTASTSLPFFIFPPKKKHKKIYLFCNHVRSSFLRRESKRSECKSIREKVHSFVGRHAS